MSQFSLSREAFLDIEAIWDYVAQDSIDAADRMRDQILAAFRVLATHPRIGHSRTDWTDEPV